MSPLNTADLHRLFDMLDRNGDGFVSLDDLIWLLERLGMKTSEDELELLLGQKGLDRIDFAIFCNIVIGGKKNVDGGVIKEEEVTDQSQLILETDLIKAFEVFDLNRDGFISSEELQSALCRLGLLDEKCGKDCRNMISEYDTNSDGKLDFEEFKSMMFSNS